MQIKCLFTFGMQTKSTVELEGSEHQLYPLHGQPGEERAGFPLLSMPVESFERVKQC